MPSPHQFTLESPRLLINPLTMDDLETVHHISNQAFGEVPLAERRAWLQWTVLNYQALANLHQPPYGDYAIRLRSASTLIGLVGVVPSFLPFDLLPSFANRLQNPDAAATKPRPEMGLFWSLGADYRGQGYATEAAQRLIAHLFEVWQVQRLVATTEYDNAASIAVMQRLGMRIEHNPNPDPVWFQVVGVLFHPELGAG